MKNWYKRWMLKRIIMALRVAVENHGLKPEVCSFAGNMEATFAMAQGAKKDAKLTLHCTKQELGVFIGYMIQLHNSKLSLLTRARIGLATLLMDAGKLMPKGMTLQEFVAQEYKQAKSSKDDKLIVTE